MKRNSSITVVHLDDDGDILELTREFVERNNERITMEGYLDPESALTRIFEGDVDCVVTDYKMSTMDGLGFLREVRETDPALPVIFFTGKGSEEIASEAISLGVTDYLQKGTGSEQFQILGNRIDSLVTRRRAEQRAAEADQRIRQIYERITVAFLGLDTDYRITYMNTHAESLFEADHGEFEGARLWEAVPSLADSPFETELRRSMTDQVDTHCEGDADIGTEHKHLHMHAYPSEDGISVFVDDVTEAVHREAELEDLRNELEITEQQFRTLRQKLSRPVSPFR
ncbi:response regulator [Halorarius litoreus]|uniref:response regulator n=1 Tax=Halorarius litoreus TaxID=2962676 RepID=UPI0020CC4437|nr:response regulator [Halorarius litoreus]